MPALPGHLPLSATRIALLLVVVVMAVLGSFVRPSPASAADEYINIVNHAVTEGDSGSTNALVPLSFHTHVPRTVTVTVVEFVPWANGDISEATVSVTVNGTGTAYIPIAVFGDLDREGTQWAFLQASATLFPVGGVTDEATLTVNDNDTPALSIANFTTSEGFAGSHTITLSKAINQSVTFRVTTSNAAAVAGIDYIAEDAVITLPANTQSMNLNIVTIADGVIEMNTSESYTVTITEVSSGQFNPGGGDLVATGTINDIRPANATPRDAVIHLNGGPAVCNDIFVFEPAGGNGTVTFRITLAASSPVPFEFRLRANNSQAPSPVANSSDFVSLDSIRVFPAGQASTTFNVTLRDDSNTEGNENFLVFANGPMFTQQPCFTNVDGPTQKVVILANFF